MNWTLFCGLSFNLWFNALMSYICKAWKNNKNFTIWDGNKSHHRSYIHPCGISYSNKKLSWYTNYVRLLVSSNNEIIFCIYWYRIGNFALCTFPKHSCKLRCSTFHHYTMQHILDPILTTHTKSYTREVSNLKIWSTVVVMRRKYS